MEAGVLAVGPVVAKHIWDRWDTFVMDPVARGWREQILTRAAALERQGYGGLFLDTLDSYEKALESPDARRDSLWG